MGFIVGNTVRILLGGRPRKPMTKSSFVPSKLPKIDNLLLATSYCGRIKWFSGEWWGGGRGVEQKLVAGCKIALYGCPQFLALNLRRAISSTYMTHHVCVWLVNAMCSVPVCFCPWLIVCCVDQTSAMLDHGAEINCSVSVRPEHADKPAKDLCVLWLSPSRLLCISLVYCCAMFHVFQCIDFLCNFLLLLPSFLVYSTRLNA